MMYKKRDLRKIARHVQDRWDDHCEIDRANVKSEMGEEWVQNALWYKPTKVTPILTNVDVRGISFIGVEKVTGCNMQQCAVASHDATVRDCDLSHAYWNVLGEFSTFHDCQIESTSFFPRSTVVLDSCVGEEIAIRANPSQAATEFIILNSNVRKIGLSGYTWEPPVSDIVYLSFQPDGCIKQRGACWNKVPNYIRDKYKPNQSTPLDIWSIGL